MSEDFIMTAEVEFSGKGGNPHRKAGLMIRESLDSASPYADVMLHGDGLTALQFRTENGGTTDEIRDATAFPQVIQLERRGNLCIMRTAEKGTPLQVTGTVELELGNSVYAGMAICSHDDNAFEKAAVSNLRFDIPFRGGREGISRLEILDLETGLRKIVYRQKGILEAPNWTRDGRALLYNSGGKLYQFDLATRSSTAIDTGSATGINNDHLISPDGTELAISHRVETAEINGSTISILPAGGGEPRMITSKVPSYLHGWSPDGNQLLYTARREGQYDIYMIPVAGGEEVRLTNHPKLDDGPEYSPDGKWVYFNSARTGTMQVWRMRPDGSEPRQITRDRWNDWFPHVSPDGRRAIFLSYPPEVDSEDHPRNKRVMLRTMTPEGRAITAAAYLYGGQGTINVPSWSPDSGKAAFVSYTFEAADTDPER